ncbi:hypothetical protein FA95DRAFT_1529264, partial [Auriscalpium vulgare]
MMDNASQCAGHGPLGEVSSTRPLPCEIGVKTTGTLRWAAYPASSGGVRLSDTQVAVAVAVAMAPARKKTRSNKEYSPYSFVVEASPDFDLQAALVDSLRNSDARNAAATHPSTPPPHAPATSPPAQGQPADAHDTSTHMIGAPLHAFDASTRPYDSPPTPYGLPPNPPEPAPAPSTSAATPSSPTHPSRAALQPQNPGLALPTHDVGAAAHASLHGRTPILRLRGAHDASLRAHGIGRHGGLGAAEDQSGMRTASSSESPCSRRPLPEPTDAPRPPLFTMGSASEPPANSRQHVYQAIRRRKERGGGAPAPSVRARVVTKYKSPSLISSALDAGSLPVARGAFIGHRHLPPDAARLGSQPVELRTLLDRYRLRLVEWNGSGNRVVVDRNRRIVAPMAGAPDGDSTWPGIIAQANDDYAAVLKDCIFTTDQLKSKRGKYPFLHMGFSHGGGRTEPLNLRPANDSQERAFCRLGGSKALSRFAGHVSGVARMFGPRMLRRYADVVRDVRRNNPALAPPFSNSVFPTATFNFGPQVATSLHRDHLNVPYGWCSVTALGSYDHRRGGHLILWELGLVLEFPPGSTILLPSALVTHGNTPIQEGETRYSFTQYIAGALMRWHTYGFRTEDRLAREDPALKASLDREAVVRAAEALGLFSTLDELQSDHAEQMYGPP